VLTAIPGVLTIAIAVPLRTAASLREHARISEHGKGWFDDNYLGIDQGPIIAMIETISALVWGLMKRNPYIVRGLCRAGITGGWIQGRCN
jgi:hypothetical protein